MPRDNAALYEAEETEYVNIQKGTCIIDSFCIHLSELNYCYEEGR